MRAEQAPNPGFAQSGNLANWLGPVLEQIWQDPAFQQVPTSAHYRASMRFLLGSELVLRFGPDPRLALLGGLPNNDELQRLVENLGPRIAFWGIAAIEPGFNSFVNLLNTWRMLIHNLEDAETTEAMAFQLPFLMNGPEQIQGFLAACRALFKRSGDWLSLGLLDIHRWTDEDIDGPPSPFDSLTTVLAAPYSDRLVERHVMASVMASAPRLIGKNSDQCVESSVYLGAYAWARRCAIVHPEVWAELFQEIDNDPDGPDASQLIRFYRHIFKHQSPGTWDSDIASKATEFARKTIPLSNLPSFCEGPAVFRAAIDLRRLGGAHRNPSPRRSQLNSYRRPTRKDSIPPLDFAKRETQ